MKYLRVILGFLHEWDLPGKLWTCGFPRTKVCTKSLFSKSPLTTPQPFGKVFQYVLTSHFTTCAAVTFEALSFHNASSLKFGLYFDICVSEGWKHMSLELRVLKHMWLSSLRATPASLLKTLNKLLLVVEWMTGTTDWGSRAVLLFTLLWEWIALRQAAPHGRGWGNDLDQYTEHLDQYTDV